MRLLPPSLLLALIAAPLSAAAQSVALTGTQGETAALSAEAVAALPRVTVAFDAHGVSHVYEGPLLLDLLKAVNAPTGSALRGPRLADVVLVTASDGYQVAYGLAELDPGTRPNRIILADRADGRPLSEAAGPFQVVVEGDLRPARSIRQVTRVEIRALAAAPAVDAARHP